MKTRSFFLYLGLFVFVFGSVHQINAQCDLDPMPAQFCVDAPLQCLIGLCFTTRQWSANGEPPNWCGPNTAVHNPQYFRLRATAAEGEIRVLVVSCNTGQCGLQAALIAECPWQVEDVIACDEGTPEGGTMVVEVEGLIIGQEYLYMIDGCGADICEYRFESIIGFGTQIMTEVDTIMCMDSIVIDGQAYGPGEYQIVYPPQGENHCDSIVALHVMAQTSVTLPPVTICSSADIVQVTPWVTGIGGDYTFLWSNNTADSVGTYSGLEQGDLICLTVTDAEGCIGTACTIVNTQVQVVVTPDITTICPEAEIDSFGIVVTGHSGSYEIFWIDGLDTLSGIPYPISSPGQFEVLVVDSAGCTGSTVVTLTEHDTLEVEFFPAEIGICSGANLGVGLIPNGTPPYQFEWQTPDGQYFDSVLVISSGGEYFLTVTDANGCSGTSILYVEEHPLPEIILEPSLEACADSLAAGIEVSVETSADVILLIPEGWAGPPFIVDTPGIYSITAVNEFGCQTSDTIVLSILGAPTVQPVVESCQLTAYFSYTGDASGVVWDFGDGNTDTIHQPDHEYAFPGNYTATLTAWNSCDTSVIAFDVNPHYPVMPSHADCENAVNIGTLNTYHTNCTTAPDSGFYCLKSSNLHARPGAFDDGCSGFADPVAWYVFSTDASAVRANIGLVHIEFPAASIRLFESPDGSCSDLIPVPLTQEEVICVMGTDGKLLANETPVKPLTTYYLAVSAVNSRGGEYDLCLNTVDQSVEPCVLDREIKIVQRSFGGSLNGPFFPGEELEICMIVDVFDVNTGIANCQWFQALVPVFGSGWDLNSFNDEGMPNNATLNGNQFPAQNIHNGGMFEWWDNVRYHHSHCYLKSGDFNGDLWVDLCHTLLDPDCTQGGFQGACCTPCWSSTSPEEPGVGTPLSRGWFTSGVDGSCGGLSGWPAVDWGDGNTCNGPTGPWEFCFTLGIRQSPEPGNRDLTLGFFTFADGEVGSWVGTESSVCRDDMPLLVKLPLCSSQPNVSSDTVDPVCSRTPVIIDPVFAIDQVWTWQSSGTNAISGGSSGTGNCTVTVIDTLINADDTIAYLTYEFVTFHGYCPSEVKQLILPVYPDISVDFNTSLNVCDEVDTLLIEPLITGSTDYNYLWHDVSVDSTYLLTEFADGSQVGLTVTDNQTGCSGNLVEIIDTSGVHVSADPAEPTLCSGDPDGPNVTLHVAGNGPFEYAWTVPGDTTVFDMQPPFDRIGTYSVTVTDVFGCSGMSAVNVLEDQPAVAAFTFNVAGDEVTFTNASSHADSVEWDFQDGNTSTEWSPVHTFNHPGDYFVRLIVYGPCSKDTIVQLVHISGVGTLEELLNRSLYIYPNPNDGYWTLHTGDFIPDAVRGYDIYGKEIVIENSGSEYVINSDVGGVFLLEIRFRTTSVFRKVTVIK